MPGERFGDQGILGFNGGPLTVAGKTYLPNQEIPIKIGDTIEYFLDISAGSGGPQPWWELGEAYVDFEMGVHNFTPSAVPLPSALLCFGSVWDS